MPLVKFDFVVGLVLLDLQFARRKLRFLICCLHEGRRRAETLSVVTFGIKFRHRKRTFQILPFFFALRDFPLHYGQKRHVPAKLQPKFAKTFCMLMPNIQTCVLSNN